ncbi:reducing type I polyketide synthase [Lasiosphaeris hirsuta]|uniref:Reducing type I polyketide synthase n=1 Tax=Lasiosphaeris hirsuta TaxID=260670 RepID=A0AA39ZRM8_9PEZI|nr:reducing type I polyketide synthase [Lasiosphaeris hirsuta]
MVANDSSASAGHAAYGSATLSNPIDHVNGQGRGGVNPLDGPLNASGFNEPPNHDLNIIPQANGSTAAVIGDSPKQPFQTPIAVVGLACRLPGHSTSPKALWDFIKRGGIAGNRPPDSRFNLEGHYDGSKKPHTMRSPGGMFLEDVDPRDFDAQFFSITTVDAIAMDPQQRQLLEVVYECLENSGTPLERISGSKVGCFVGSYAVDFGDMQARDPEDRAESITIGIGRAILSNRISHFLNIRGPSLVSVDVACQYLNARQADGMLVAGANIYLSPDHNMDMGAMRGASSATGKCHTFDAKADGYIKGEAINAVYLKRLDDAIRDGDPIRGVIRGSATNSDGWTPGIASPSSDAQATAIRTAYSNAGITDFNETGFLECHGTGTLAGDPIEVAGAASVFGPTRSQSNPLVIGSIKSNIGHSEPAAGISGLIKAVLAVESGTIPGNPTFVDPNPKIEFEKLRVKATRQTIKWPHGYQFRRASVNSFGYGGSNAHVVVDEATHVVNSSALRHVSSFAGDVEDFFDLGDDEDVAVSKRPKVLVASANDEESLKSQINALTGHLLNPAVKVKLDDLAYTLSERRTRHYRRAFTVSKTTELSKDGFVFGKKKAEAPRIGFIFTGQGAQWPQMGRDLIANFPSARQVLERLDKALHALPVPPKWSLISELSDARSPEHLRLPEFSQPLVTALQLATLTVLRGWGVEAQSVVGHSSGEIAAAAAAGLLSYEDAIKIAYFRGLAAKNLPSPKPVGMLAVGVGAEGAQQYIDAEDPVEIACYNSPSSVTLSGTVPALEKTKERLQKDNQFARLLQVNLAYHSSHMAEIGDHYETLLLENVGAPLKGSDSITMFSSVTGTALDIPVDSSYWKANMVSPVRFAQAAKELLSGKNGADFLIEIGPSNGLSGPVTQIKQSLPGEGAEILYTSTAKRGPSTLLSLYDVAGRLFIAGGAVDLTQVNKDDDTTEQPSVIIDLPNYSWNHTKKYWQESEASKDWRFRKFVNHDLLGTKVLSSPWQSPTWKKTLRLADVSWLKDHKMGHEVIFPGAGYVAMAVEAVFQATFATAWDGKVPAKYRYKLRDLKFPRALVLDEKTEQKINLVLTPLPRSSKSWFEYKVSSLNDGVWSENSTGFVRIETDFVDTVAPEAALKPLQYPTPGRLWYKAMQDAGYNFGNDFQKHLEVESTVGQFANRSLVALEPPPSTWAQSHYPIHPANMDGAFQSVAPSLWQGDRSSIDAVLVPAIVDSITIYPRREGVSQGISVATSEFIGVGRKESKKNYFSSCQVFSPEDGALLFELKGLRYHQLQTRGDVYTTHPYARLEWKPDVTLLSEPQLQTVLSGSETAVAVQSAIDLLTHKFPTLKVAEINLDSADDDSTLWISDGESPIKSTRAAYSTYHFFTNNPTALINLQDKHASAGNATFTLADLTRPDFISPEEEFDLVIAKAAKLHGDAFEVAARHISGLLSGRGYALFVQTTLQEPAASGASLKASGFDGIQQLLAGSADVYLAQRDFLGLANGIASKKIHLIHLAEEGVEAAAAKAVLQERGWSFAEYSGNALDDLPERSNVLILNELDGSVLEATNKVQWQALQTVIRKESNILWVTQGAQLKVSNPTKAAAQGFLRVLRAEEPALQLLTLDVESSSGPITHSAVDTALRLLLTPAKATQNETEYVERDGVIHVSRVLPDELINVAKIEDAQGRAAKTASLHDSEHTIRLRAEHLGNIDSLFYGEVSKGPIPLPPNTVEVELYAAGLNFKDVAVTMGIVPENEHLLGLEGAGVVRRVASDVTKFKLGQRVVVFEKGTFANRIIATTERTHALPDSMTFEEASTLPAVYLTSMYSLFHLANLKRGEGKRKSVLIHSASGGVGIASIQLAQYVGAEIFVTVGTQEKRDFLKNTFGIPDDHIFSSRNTEFAGQILKITQGYGVDVILNSLTGELLEESWRIIADGGTMVEIGKKDILDRNSLSMEPFSRNASFRALDFSYREISDALIAEYVSPPSLLNTTDVDVVMPRILSDANHKHRILSQLFQLISEGHVKPIAPITTFTYEDIPAAFRVLRGGKHIGKLVVTNGLDAKVEVPVRPSPRALSLRQDVSYLIIGGLKGLCGSLAVYLAKNGAKYISVLSRSGHNDDKSQGVVKNIRALGAHIDLLQGDVANTEDIRRVFKETAVPIGGIIQGAMVLRDRTFGSMTIDEYHGALACKLQGTWNLHNTALEQGLVLDFFTLLSSISGVVGQKGQANYAAGNAVLDAFAVYRQGLGLAANSVDLGVIEDIGYIHDHDGLQQNLDTSIWTGINEGLLRRILEYSIYQQQDPSQVLNPASTTQLITGIPVPQPDESGLARDARFAPLFIRAGASAGGSGGSGSGDGAREIQAFLLLAKSKGADPAAVVAAAIEITNKHFTKTLRLTEPIESARPLATYGLDSLAAVEIRNWVRMTLGAELTTLEIVNATSLVALSEKIVSKILVP